MIERQQVNLRLERELVDQLDDLARTEHVDRTEIARRILVVGVSEARVDRALGDYAAGRVTAWKAARDAGVSLYEMLDRIHERGIPYELDPEDFARLSRVPARVAERDIAYGISSDADTGVAELRARYKPALVRTLFVGESSPAQGTHFYRANSNLYRATRDAYADALGEDAVPSGEAFLRFFRDEGGWLVDLADKPVNRLSDSDRREAVEAGVPRLAEVIRSEHPVQIVVVKRDIADAVRRALALTDVVASILVLPFPVRQWAPVYRRDLAQFLRARRVTEDPRTPARTPPRSARTPAR
jgi:predicted HTH domain antitoxin